MLGFRVAPLISVELFISVDASVALATVDRLNFIAVADDTSLLVGGSPVDCVDARAVTGIVLPPLYLPWTFGGEV